MDGCIIRHMTSEHVVPRHACHAYFRSTYDSLTYCTPKLEQNRFNRNGRNSTISKKARY
jgi:hypothetical protein